MEKHPAGMDSDTRAVKILREYLKIQTVHPNPKYDECVKFLKNLADDIGLPVRVIELVERKPIVIMTYAGTAGDLKSIMLNSHMDVVPVELDKWNHDPFAAEMDKDGNIYARGAQDMKCVGIQYLEAVRRLKQNNISLKRTIHIVFVPDEEIGGEDGMYALTKSKEFKYLFVGLCMDEGFPNVGEEFNFCNGDKARWVVEFRCSGRGGHASQLVDDTPGEKLRKILDKMDDFRNTQMEVIRQDPNTSPSEYTSSNLTIIQGGFQENVIPDQYVAAYDMRIGYNIKEEELESRIRQWAKESGENVVVTFKEKIYNIPPTKLDESNPFWISFKTAAAKMNLKLKIQISPASADARFVRKIGIPAFNFSPMNYTQPLLHTHNEYINRDTFLKGINIYYNLIEALANTA